MIAEINGDSFMAWSAICLMIGGAIAFPWGYICGRSDKDDEL